MEPLSVLITTQGFPPEIHPGAVMAEDLATGLVRRGFRVTVATGLPHHGVGRVPPQYQRVWQVESRSGFRVVRLWHPTSESRRIPARAWVMATQALATMLGAASVGRHDVVLSFGGPPLLGPVGSGLLAKAWGAALVTVIHDLYPDVAMESGAVRSSVISRTARMLESLQYSLSDRLIVLGPVTRDGLIKSRGIDPGSVVVIPVWLDPDEIVPGPRDNEWRRAQGIGPERLVVLYAGTAGIISGAEILDDVARRLDSDVDVVMVGGGSAWQALAQRRREGRLAPNLRLLPYQPREQLSLLQASADLSLVTLLPGRGRTSVPSKVQGYMAAGRPVLAAVDPECDTAKLVRRGQFGLVVTPDDVDAIVEGVRQSLRDPTRRGEWGRRARAVFEAEYARDPILDRYAALIRSTIGPVPPHLALLPESDRCA